MQCPENNPPQVTKAAEEKLVEETNLGNIKEQENVAERWRRWRRKSV